MSFSRYCNVSKSNNSNSTVFRTDIFIARKHGKEKIKLSKSIPEIKLMFSIKFYIYEHDSTEYLQFQFKNKLYFPTKIVESILFR